MLEFAPFNILFDELNRSAVMIVEDVDYAILVEEIEFNEVVKLVGINFVFGGSISTSLTLFHRLSKLIKTLHFLEW